MKPQATTSGTGSAGTVGTEKPLTDKQERFAVEWSRTGNRAAAYRAAYDVGPTTAPATVWVEASRIAALPQVQKRFDELQAQAALEMIVSVQDALKWQLDIATADPNEIAFTAKRACRYCYGNDHAYQFIDDNEYTEKCVEAIDNRKAMPDGTGGFGYSKFKPPVSDCPRCNGHGFNEVVTNDTRYLSDKARKLYKGIDYKNGEYVVTMHDQAKAWEMACRILGAFNDKLDLTGGKRRAGDIPEGVSEQEAAKQYLALIG